MSIKLGRAWLTTVETMKLMQTPNVQNNSINKQLRMNKQ